MLTRQLAASKEQIAAGVFALADARRNFAKELAKLRRSHDQNEQPLAAAEKRALLEIEGERTAAGRARKELQTANERMALLETKHRSERDALRDGLATAKAELAAATARGAATKAQLSEKAALLAERLASANLLRERLKTMSRHWKRREPNLGLAALRAALGHAPNSKR